MGLHELLRLPVRKSSPLDTFGSYRPMFTSYGGEICNISQFMQVKILSRSNTFTIYQALHKERLVLVKRYHVPINSDVVGREEILLHKLDHPNLTKGICTFKDLGGSVHLAMECASSTTLAMLLSNRRADDPQNQRIFARQMVDVLIYLHSLNIFHNDIRPENIIISSDWSIKLVEFGVSAYRPDGKCKQLLGSALYMAPEKLFGESYNNGADWYAFGMTLYELIYKNNPFAHLGKKKDLMKSVKEGIPELGGSTADNFISMLCNTDQNLRWCPANGKEKDIMTHDFLQDPPHIHKQASIGDLRIVESGPIASLEDFSTRGD